LHTMACMVFFCLTPTLADLLTEKVLANTFDRKTVEQLIVRLGDREFGQRQQATQALRQQGDAILPVLLQARRHCEPEVGRRLDELIRPMQVARVLSPRRVTLPGNQSPREYAALLGAQSGYLIHADNLETKTRLDLPCKDEPFWPALDRLCDSTGCSFVQNGQDEGIRLVGQNSESPYRSYDGIFRVNAQGFRYTRSTHFAQVARHAQFGNQISELLALDLIVQVEPKTSLLKVGRPRLALAEDEEKRSMAPSGEGQFAEVGGINYGGNFGRGRAQQVSLGLMMPGRNSRQVSRVKGVIPVTLLAEQKPIVVTDKLLESKGKKFKVGNATFLINEVEIGKGSEKHYQFKINYDEATTEMRYDYSRIQTIQQRLELRDAHGNKIPMNASLTQFNSPTSAQFVLGTLRFSSKDAPPPAQLLFIDWVQLEHEVAFELKDLPLP
jgi:hypothetical protein